jgi:acyl-CoA synthetase (NDP forming)
MRAQIEVAADVAGAPARRSIGHLSTRALLGGIDMPFLETVEVTSPAQAVAVARSLAGSAGTAVLKLISDEVVHKSEHGFVRLGVPVERADEAFSELGAAAADLGVDDAKIVVQPTVGDGVDLIIGADRDPVFGPVLVIGLGGVTVELFRDVTTALVPVTAGDVHELLRSLAGFPLLDGFRGGPAYDITRFARLVADLSNLLVRDVSIAELDLNPVRLLADGRCLILDSRAAVTLDCGQPTTPRASRDLTALLRPRHVAVIGASRDPTRPGGKVVRALLDKGFAGPIWPVNVNADEIAGLPAYPCLDALPEIPDVACIALPAEDAVAAVADCVAARVPAVVVLASGFAEAGADGKARELRLGEILRGGDTVMCGPNTIGVVSASHHLALTFSQGLQGLALRDSGVAFIAQSGAVAGSLVSRELIRGYGVGDWVTVGSQLSLDVADYLEFLVTAPTTRAIAIFLEGASDGPRLRRALDSARRARKSVVVFKTGVSESGGRAVMSHAGALAGSAQAYAAALRQGGAVQVTEMTALLELAWVLGNCPPPQGRRVGVVSTSGGAGSSVADLIEAQGLRLARLSDRTLQDLERVLPAFAKAANPLDVTAEGAFAPSVLYESVRRLAEDTGVDIGCVVLTSLAGDDAVRAARQVAHAVSASSKPILVCWLIAAELALDGIRILARAGIRVFDEPSRMVAAARQLADYADRVATASGKAAR